MSVIELQKKRAGLIQRARDLLDASEDQGERDLTKSDRQDFSALMAEADGLTEKIEKTEGPHLYRSTDVPFSLLEAQLSEIRDVAIMPGMAGEMVAGAREIIQRGTLEGMALRSDQRLTNYVAAKGQSVGNLSVEKALLGVVLGDWRGAEEERDAMGTSPDGLGRYLVPSPIASQVFDIARSKMVTIAAGARTVPMDSKTLSLAKITEDCGLEWKEENEAATPSTVTLDQVLLTAHTLYAGPVLASLELLRDAVNAGQVVTTAITGAYAVELDRATLAGIDEFGPLGLAQTPNIGEVDHDAALADYSPFIEAYEMLLTANVDPANMSLIMSPAVDATLEGLTDKNDQPLNAPRFFENMRRKLTTSSIATDEAGDSYCVMGDFSNLLIGLGMQMTLEASNYSGTAWESYQASIRGVLKADAQVVRPDQFVLISGLAVGEPIGS